MSSKSKILTILTLSVFVVLLVGGIATGAYYLGTKQSDDSENTSNVDTQIETRTEENVTTSEISIDPETLEYSEYATEDNLVTVKYPSSWVKSEMQDPSQMVSEDVLQKYDLEIPLIATAPNAEETTLIVLTGMTVSSTKLPAEIFEEMVQESSGTGTEIEILNKKQIDDNIVFEAKYTINNLTFRSKEILLLFPPEGNDRPAYVVSFQTDIDDWDKYEELADYVIDDQLKTEETLN